MRIVLKKRTQKKPDFSGSSCDWFSIAATPSRTVFVKLGYNRSTGACERSSALGQSCSGENAADRDWWRNRLVCILRLRSLAWDHFDSAERGQPVKNHLVTPWMRRQAHQVTAWQADGVIPSSSAAA